MNKDQYLAKFREERARWDALAAELGEARMNQSGAMGDWTFKDLVAHMTGWRERTAMRVAMGCSIEAEKPAWWPHDVDEDSDAGTEQVNQVIYEINRGRTVHDVLEDSERVTRQLEDAITALTDDALTSPTCFAWTVGKPLVEIDFYDHWHTEHEPQVRQWLAKVDSAMKW